MDAVAAAAFACGVETITTPGDSANIVLRTSSVRGRAAAKIFLGSFMLGINIVVFYKQKLSNATCQQLSGRLDGIWWSSVADRKDGKAPTKLIFDLSGELDDLFEEATTGEVDFFLEITNIVGVVPSDFTKTKYLVSVAKTCTISREDQLWWRNTDDALATVFYCHVDTLLTFGEYGKLAPKRELGGRAERTYSRSFS